MRRPTPRLFVPSLLCVGLFLAQPAPAEPRLLLDGAYPLEVSITAHAALLHWLDSLAAANGPGMTAGKTIDAHRQDYVKAHGKLTGKDLEVLKRFHAVRIDPDSYKESPAEFTAAFLASPHMSRALETVQEGFRKGSAEEMTQALRYFETRYSKIWNRGDIPMAFVERVSQDDQREALGEFIASVARFFGISPKQQPYPLLVLAPVRRGFGTHAQAVGRVLLVEVRRGDGLLHQIPPIVHENVHFLFYRASEAKRDALRQRAFELGDKGEQAWSALHEALPTAIAQGVAAEKFFGSRWSDSDRWYHLDPVDAYSKRLYPTIKEALSNGGSFDEAFLDRAIDLF